MPRRTRRLVLLGGFCSGVSLLLLVCVILPVLFLFSSCSVNRYIVAYGLPAPDSGFQTGTVFGYNVWIWECYQGKRIVLYNETAEMYARAFEREEVPCGGRSPIEKALATEKSRSLDPKNFW